MAIQRIERHITLDVYDHDTTPETFKAIACDNDSRYVVAEIQNEGVWFDIGSSSTVELTVIRPDGIGVSITGEPYPIEYTIGGEIDPETEQETPVVTETYYGVYAELDQPALAISGTLLGQFKITSGTQILRTEIFKIKNGRALDAETDEWADEYQGYSLSEVFDKGLMYKLHDVSITDSKMLAPNKVHNINTSWYTDLLSEFGGSRMGILVNLGLETQKHYQILLFDNGTMYQRYITADNASVGNWMPVQNQKCQVINTINEMNTVTADRVLVLHNNSAYGDGGPCFFEYLSYVTETGAGYVRKDGGRMLPMLDQGPLLTSDPPVEKMMGLISSYVENDALIYGNDNTLFDGTTENDIDCSSFVSAILHGISYSSSSYVTDNSLRRVARTASYSPIIGTIFGHRKSRFMAQYFAEHKWLHSMPSHQNLRNVLHFGDILFSWDGKEESRNRFLEIGHVSIVLAVLNNTHIIVAQCGGYPDAVTSKNNSTTVGKISTILVGGDNISTYFRAFARIPYINEHEHVFTGNKIKPVFIPNVYCTTNRNGELSSSEVNSTTYGYISVMPGSTLTFTGATSHNGNNLYAYVNEYDSCFAYLGQTNFTTTPKVLNAATRYIRLSYAHTSGSGIPMLLDDCNQFEATIT